MAMEQALGLGPVLSRLRRGLDLRKQYTPTRVPCVKDAKVHDLAKSKEIVWEFRDGLIHVANKSDGSLLLAPQVSCEQFYKDCGELCSIRSDGSVNTFCFHRLRLLSMKFELYILGNSDVELGEQLDTPHRDFYNVRKVDTHIHHSAAMNGKHLLRFIKKKLKSHSEDFVMTRSGKRSSLKEVFRDLGIGWAELSLDKLNVVADQNCFHRFDRFNLKYNPLDQPELRSIFLKTDNEIGGRYLAEITKELLSDLEESKYQHTEWRLSIYGRKRGEWDALSKWVVNNELLSEHNFWMIQVPRLYSGFQAAGQVKSFQEMLDNIFLPLLEATVDPEGHPEIARFLEHVSGFDSVDDESKSSTQRTKSSVNILPTDWTSAHNPSYRYYAFYLQANIRTLNRLRAACGMSQFDYRPHAGEAGEIHHLDTAFLLADSVAHGLNLRKSMALQYLYFLTSIGIAMSPCSNNHLFLSYQKHPFHEFFARGLNVSLSTDDPLMFHQTKEPLMEEYSLAKQFFRLTSADVCELARNSVLQSGYPEATKARWLGSADRSVNDVTRTNVPQARVWFRSRCLASEVKLLMKESPDMEDFSEGIPRLPEDMGQGLDEAPPPSALRRTASASSAHSASGTRPWTPMMAPMGGPVLPELVELDLCLSQATEEEAPAPSGSLSAPRRSLLECMPAPHSPPAKVPRHR